LIDIGNRAAECWHAFFLVRGVDVHGAPTRNQERTMQFAKTAAVGIGILVLAGATSAQRPGSDEIVVPHGDGRSGLCVPFDCATRIQQVFDSATIPSMIRIDALDLFNNAEQSAEGFIEPAHYQIFLSTTEASSTTLSVDMDANVGHNARLVADFTVADFNRSFTGAFRIPFAAPFVYNPRAGNLLLEIGKDHTANFGDGPIYVDGTGQGTGVALVTNQLGLQPGFGMSVGLVGQFLGPFNR
jgi:hypothetical protein